jgi:hypothetical protein
LSLQLWKKTGRPTELKENTPHSTVSLERTSFDVRPNK